MFPYLRVLAILLFLPFVVSCTSSPNPPTFTQAAETTALPAATSAQLGSSGPGRISLALMMNVPRAAHTATLLPDGKVLITGGFRSEGTAEIPIASAEIFDPEMEEFTPTGDMRAARTGHTATLLPDGQVLIVGGWGLNGRIAAAELFDPQTGTFRVTGSMSAPRASMTATLLPDGQVLIAGGDSARRTPQLAAELYNPATGKFTPSGSLNHGRSAHTATLLASGDVLLVGGSTGQGTVLASAEIYHPGTGIFTETGSLRLSRHKHAAVLLGDSNVLVIGGSNQDDWAGKYNSVELYDVGIGQFIQFADLNAERFKLADAAVLLKGGNVLVAGGNRQVEIFDTQNQIFLPGGRLDDDYFFSVAVVLQDGRVLITGGYNAHIQPSDKAWIYTPG